MKNLKGLDTRQVPKLQKICADKRYHDILYSFLQENSQWDGVQGHPRYVDKKLINFTQLGKILGLSRQTVSTKFQNLIKLNLVSEIPDNAGRYNLSILPAEAAGLIPEPTLKLLVDTLSEHSISTYLYLLMRYVANGEQPFIFTLADIKKYIGICTTTRSNDDVITNILFVLKKLDLIKYELVVLEKNNEMKTVYQLNYLTNYIENINC